MMVWAHLGVTLIVYAIAIIGCVVALWALAE